MSMHSQFITRLQVMAPLLVNLSDGSGYYFVVWYEFMSELVFNINVYVFIETGCVI